ncbi:MAG: carboxypeptidase-like regulatory domain-containing protein [Patescibacteria group bacterium]
MIQNTKYKILNTKNGFTIIEALVLLFIFCLVTVSFYSTLTLGLRYIQDSKNRLGATALANERMEIVRNLKYDSIGTEGGEIEGNILQDENVAENTRQYSVHTLVEYVDDPIDGLAGEDSAWWADYKRVTITVSWNNSNLSNGKVVLSSFFPPPGREVQHLGDGILSVNVCSDQGEKKGVPDSYVHIQNSETGLNTGKDTDTSGYAVFMGSNVRDSVQKYEITASKDGYETVSTMPPYPITSYIPDFPHATVITAGGAVNVAYIIQNKLAENLTIFTENYLGESLPNIDFHLIGGKKIGKQPAEPFDAVYNLDSNEKTNGDGKKDLGAVSPGDYTFSLVNPALANYEIISADPYLQSGSSFEQFSLSSDQSLNFKIKLASKSETSILVKVVDTNSSPISGAQVKLSNTSGYDITQSTTSEGNAFFPTTSDLFASGTYDLKVTADGFQDNDSQVIISTNQLKVETITLLAP